MFATIELHFDGRLTLSHVILEVVPLDVVGQVAHVDAAVLLGGLVHGLDHLLLCWSAVFVAARWARGTVVVVVSVRWSWRALVAVATVVVAVAVAAWWRSAVSSAGWRGGAASRALLLVVSISKHTFAQPFRVK